MGTVPSVAMPESGRTGSLVAHAMGVVLMRGQGSRIRRRRGPMPGILPRPVALDPALIGV
ncbi:hypothetical protein KPL78_02275 [Roseomonas sp. HJA6]|uniref:Uncharacterized protein n=1 Tax=Roseomonas alba TaxID=2846776 RepID=A0ABS7A2Y8_9PROT|nr:hypothetical protein [Neoroseomonas alba]MBW6396651.1 hypothetical protein [Neoroseomonas alba]